MIQDTNTVSVARILLLESENRVGYWAPIQKPGSVPVARVANGAMEKNEIDPTHTLHQRRESSTSSRRVVVCAMDTVSYVVPRS